MQQASEKHVNLVQADEDMTAKREKDLTAEYSKPLLYPEFLRACVHEGGIREPLAAEMRPPSNLFASALLPTLLVSSTSREAGDNSGSNGFGAGGGPADLAAHAPAAGAASGALLVEGIDSQDSDFASYELPRPVWKAVHGDLLAGAASAAGAGVVAVGHGDAHDDMDELKHAEVSDGNVNLEFDDENTDDYDDESGRLQRADQQPGTKRQKAVIDLTDDENLDGSGGAGAGAGSCNASMRTAAERIFVVRHGRNPEAQAPRQRGSDHRTKQSDHAAADEDEIEEFDEDNGDVNDAAAADGDGAEDSLGAGIPHPVTSSSASSSFAYNGPASSSIRATAGQSHAAPAMAAIFRPSSIRGATTQPTTYRLSATAAACSTRPLRPPPAPSAVQRRCIHSAGVGAAASAAGIGASSSLRSDNDGWISTRPAVPGPFGASSAGAAAASSSAAVGWVVSQTTSKQTNSKGKAATANTDAHKPKPLISASAARFLAAASSAAATFALRFGEPKDVDEEDDGGAADGEGAADGHRQADDDGSEPDVVAQGQGAAENEVDELGSQAGGAYQASEFENAQRQVYSPGALQPYADHEGAGFPVGGGAGAAESPSAAYSNSERPMIPYIGHVDGWGGSMSMAAGTAFDAVDDEQNGMEAGAGASTTADAELEAEAGRVAAVQNCALADEQDQPSFENAQTYDGMDDQVGDASMHELDAMVEHNDGADTDVQVAPTAVFTAPQHPSPLIPTLQSAESSHARSHPSNDGEAPAGDNADGVGGPIGYTDDAAAAALSMPLVPPAPLNTCNTESPGASSSSRDAPFIPSSPAARGPAHRASRTGAGRVLALARSPSAPAGHASAAGLRLGASALYETYSTQPSAGIKTSSQPSSGMRTASSKATSTPGSARKGAENDQHDNYSNAGQVSSPLVASKSDATAGGVGCVSSAVREAAPAVAQKLGNIVGDTNAADNSDGTSGTGVTNVLGSAIANLEHMARASAASCTQQPVAATTAAAAPRQHRVAFVDTQPSPRQPFQSSQRPPSQPPAGEPDDYRGDVQAHALQPSAIAASPSISVFGYGAGAAGQYWATQMPYSSSPSSASSPSQQLAASGQLAPTAGASSTGAHVQPQPISPIDLVMPSQGLLLQQLNTPFPAHRLSAIGVSDAAVSAAAPSAAQPVSSQSSSGNLSNQAASQRSQASSNKGGSPGTLDAGTNVDGKAGSGDAASDASTVEDTNAKNLKASTKANLVIGDVVDIIVGAVHVRTHAPVLQAAAKGDDGTDAAIQNFNQAPVIVGITDGPSTSSSRNTSGGSSDGGVKHTGPAAGAAAFTSTCRSGPSDQVQLHPQQNGPDSSSLPFPLGQPNRSEQDEGEGAGAGAAAGENRILDAITPAPSRFYSQSTGTRQGRSSFGMDGGAGAGQPAFVQTPADCSIAAEQSLASKYKRRRSEAGIDPASSSALASADKQPRLDADVLAELRRDSGEDDDAGRDRCAAKDGEGLEREAADSHAVTVADAAAPSSTSSSASPPSQQGAVSSGGFDGDIEDETSCSSDSGDDAMDESQFFVDELRVPLSKIRDPGAADAGNDELLGRCASNSDKDGLQVR